MPQQARVDRNLDRACSIFEITDLEGCLCLFQEEYAIFIKHSLTCSFSLDLFGTIIGFFHDYPELRVCTLSVQAARDASHLIEDQTGVLHATSQVIALGRLSGSSRFSSPHH